MHASAFDFPIEPIGLDEEPHPETVDGSVCDAQNQAIKNLPDQRAENRGALVGGPIKRPVSGKRQERELAEKPPENSIGEALAHARAVTTNIALEQHAESHADEQRHANIAWGDEDGKTLYLCAKTGLYRIRMNISGTRTPDSENHTSMAASTTTGAR